MDVMIITFGIILLLIGIAGCFIPAVPGPPVAYTSLLLLQFGESPPFTITFLVILAIAVLIVALLDHFIPVFGAKTWGGPEVVWWELSLAYCSVFLFGHHLALSFCRFLGR